MGLANIKLLLAIFVAVQGEFLKFSVNFILFLFFAQKLLSQKQLLCRIIPSEVVVYGYFTHHYFVGYSMCLDGSAIVTLPGNLSGKVLYLLLQNVECA